jgi:hypothetical protein
MGLCPVVNIILTSIASRGSYSSPTVGLHHIKWWQRWDTNHKSSIRITNIWTYRKSTNLDMAEPRVQVERVNREEIPFRHSASQDMSLVTIIPKRSGTITPIPLSEFFEGIEGSALLENWSEVDLVKVCSLKLRNSGRSFYSATPELIYLNVSWQYFKNRVL